MNAVTVIERASLALGAAEHETKLIALAARSKDIETITNDDGRKQVHSARMVLKNERINLERLGKSAREDAQAFSKAVISEEKRLIGIIAPEESRLQVIQDEWDAIEERKRQVEAARIAGLQAQIESVAAIPASMVGKASSEIAECLDQMRLVEPGTFAEFAQFAQEAKEKAITTLEQLHAGARAQEQAAAAEAKRIADEKADFERRKAELEEREKAEAARIAIEAAERVRAEADARARISAEEAAARARIEAAEAESRRKREAEEAQLKAERDRLEAARIQQEGIERAAREKAEAEAKAKRQQEEAAERAERDAAEAEENALREVEEKAERERKRQEREATETDELLCAILMRIDDKPQYAAIGMAIVAYFEEHQERKAA